MKIVPPLGQILPDVCRVIARMCGIHGEAYLNQAENLKTFSQLKSWLKPAVLVVKGHHKIFVSIRRHPNMAHPEELEAFSLLFFTHKMENLLTLDVDASGICISCRGLHLAQNCETATRFDGYALLSHIVESKVSPEFFMSAFVALGKPNGLRAEKVWHKAIGVVEDVMKELSPRRAAFKGHQQSYYSFLKAAFGGYEKVYTKTRYGCRADTAGGDMPRSVTNLLSYEDDYLIVEVTEEAGAVIEFEFASLTAGQSRFWPGRLHSMLATADDRPALVKELQTRVHALEPFTKDSPDAKKVRRNILLVLASGGAVTSSSATFKATGSR